MAGVSYSNQLCWLTWPERNGGLLPFAYGSQLLCVVAGELLNRDQTHPDGADDAGLHIGHFQR